MSRLKEEINIVEVIHQLAEEKQIDAEIIFNAIRDGIRKVYEKKFDCEAELTINFNENNGEIEITKDLFVVDEVEDEYAEITLAEARKKYGPDVQVGDKLAQKINSKEFNRLAISMSAQLIKQNIREAEKDSILEEYLPYKNKIMSGEVTAVEGKYLLAAVDRTYAFISKSNCLPKDEFYIGDRITFYVEDVFKSKNAGQIKGSRTADDFLTKLLEIEIPEVMEGIITVKAVVRNPGFRSKVAVYSSNPNVDAIGSCVGPKGSRINAVSKMLADEKIDICLWSENEEEFIVNALSPVKVLKMKTKIEEYEVWETIYSDDPEVEPKDELVKKVKKSADVVVSDEQFPLAIGRQGYAAKLVSRLTGWRLNIMRASELEASDEQSSITSSESEEIKSPDANLEVDNKEVLTQPNTAETPVVDKKEIEKIVKEAEELTEFIESAVEEDNKSEEEFYDNIDYSEYDDYYED